jgi:diguanylate cyclase
LRPRRLPLLHRYLLGLKYFRGPGARPRVQFGNRLQGIGGVANMFAADDHECTLALAEVALQQIRALRLPASPRNFEIWYHYATGQRADLNHHINSVLARKGSLDDGDLEQTYRAFFSPNRMSDRIETVGSRMADEIKAVLNTIDTAAGSATSYSASLADASVQLTGASLDGAKNAGALRASIERVVAAAKEMETSNRGLEARLSASRAEIEQLQQDLEAMRAESLSDPLTTLANRKFFDAELRKVVAQARGSREPLTLLMCDVDRFKIFNDRFGHLIGDQVLRLVGLSIKQGVKEQDIAARYGGEEFAIALPRTDLRSAVTVADQIRRAVMHKELVKRSSGERLGRLTISIGVARLRPTDTPQSLIERADKCLYAAKRNGRNRVICESDAEAEDSIGAAHVA